MPPADGMVLFDAHPGTAINLLRSLNPSLLSEEDPSAIDPALDPFSEENGYNPDGPSAYSQAFRDRYFKAQAERMNRLVDRALAVRAAMEDGSGPYPDDAPFFIPHGAARLMQLDPTIEAETREPRQLLRNDGTVVTEVVHTVRQPSPSRKRADARFSGGSFLTVHSFLGTRAVRAANAMYDIDLESNNNSTGRNLTHISVPILLMAAGGHYFMNDNEQMFETAASEDKEFIVVEGASHGIVPCGACAEAEGEDYSNSLKNTFDYVDAWVRARFQD